MTYFQIEECRGVDLKQSHQISFRLNEAILRRGCVIAYFWWVVRVQGRGDL